LGEQQLAALLVRCGFDIKLFENLQFEQLTNQLTNRHITGSRIINGKIELYSTKKAGEDKRNSKILEQKLEEKEKKLNDLINSLKIVNF
jgi:hypothetical protein